MRPLDTTAATACNTGAKVAALPARSPRLALVIGAGGVRSAAALGVMGVLEREGLRPDLVVGSSAGALFGALLACGLPADEAVTTAQRLWSRSITQRTRWRGWLDLLWPAAARAGAGFGLRDDAPVLARLYQAFGSRQLQDLPLPLRVVATDSANGQRVVLSHGALVPALRASIALPLLFTPVPIDGRLLLDGFLADPLPLGVADDAAVVVALGGTAPMPRRVDSPTRLLAQLSAVHGNQLVQSRIDTALAQGRRLLCLQPTLPRRVGLFDVKALPMLVQAGESAILARLPELRQLLAGHDRAAAGGPAGTSLRAHA